MGKSVGIIEVFGLACAMVAVDAGCKAANVTVETLDKNKPGNADALPVPLIVAIKFRGSVDAVSAAVDAAEQAAKNVSGVIAKHIIANTEDSTEKMLKLNAFDKN